MAFNKWAESNEHYVDELHAYLCEMEPEKLEDDEPFLPANGYNEREPECWCDYPKTDSLFNWMVDLTRSVSLQTNQETQPKED